MVEPGVENALPQRTWAGGHEVISGMGALQALQQELVGQGGSPRSLLLCDTHTRAVCLPELLLHVPVLRTAPVLEVEPGEACKDLLMCKQLWHALAENGADRHARLVVLGGGALTDLGGFVAATYMRGIAATYVPTTLMGMVDAAIGGKTAIDLGGTKNLIGVFSDPRGVYVHIPFLRTLPQRHVRSGLAEMLKHGLVCDATHWEEVRRADPNDMDALAPLIARSAAIKAQVVTGDPRENSGRKALNFGHTIGHALEAYALQEPEQSLLHGEAVAIGMVCEAWLSVQAGLLPAAMLPWVLEPLLEDYPAFHWPAAHDDRLLMLMRNDKKNKDGDLRFALLRAVGEAVVDVPMTPQAVRSALAYYRTHTTNAS
jgi:3-dehydroquinate synthase